MCPFKHILLLLDCSPVDDAIMEKILMMATCGNTEVTLTHVVHSHTIDQHRVLKEKADRCLSTRKKQFEAASINATELLLSGEPEEELLTEIDTGKYDLVALATHGHSGFMDFLMGSVSRHLKHHIEVPLLMIRGNK